MVFEFDGTKYERLRDMRAARRAKPPDPVRGGMDFTRAARAVGVSKRTVTAWRNGMTRCRPRRPGSREPMAMTGDRPAEVADRAATGHWEGDLDLQGRQPQRDRHPHGTHHPVHDPPAPARRARRRTRARRHHQ